MCCLDDFFHLGLYIGNLYAPFDGEADYINLSAQIISLLHGGEWKGNSLGGTALYVHISFGRRHADDLIVDAVYPYIFATRVFSRFEQAFVNTLANNADLTRFTDIYVVDKTPVCHFL